MFHQYYSFLSFLVVPTLSTTSFFLVKSATFFFSPIYIYIYISFLNSPYSLFSIIFPWKWDGTRSILRALTREFTLAQSCTPNWHSSFLLVVAPITRSPSLNDPFLASQSTQYPSLSLSLSLSLCCYINLLAVTPENLKEGDDQTVRVKKTVGFTKLSPDFETRTGRKV